MPYTIVRPYMTWPLLPVELIAIAHWTSQANSCFRLLPSFSLCWGCSFPRTTHPASLPFPCLLLPGKIFAGYLFWSFTSQHIFPSPDLALIFHHTYILPKYIVYFSVSSKLWGHGFGYVFNTSVFCTHSSTWNTEGAHWTACWMNMLFKEEDNPSSPSVPPGQQVAENQWCGWSP